MKYINLSEITFGQIQAFVCVVDFNGFTSASEYLHISQPVISKRISSLEQTLDMKLIQRSHQGIKLTDSGKIIYNSWKKLLSSMNDAINEANATANGSNKSIKIAYLATSVLKSCGDAFISENPDINVFYTKLQYPEMKAALLSGGIDIMLYGSFAETDIDISVYNFRRLFSKPLDICCSPDHPFATRKSVSVDELKNQKFIMLSPETAPTWVKMVNEICLSKQFLPDVLLYVDDFTALAMNTVGQNRIFITDDHVSYDNYNLVKVPLENQISGLTAIWKKDNHNPSISVFVNFAVNYYMDINKTELEC